MIRLLLVALALLWATPAWAAISFISAANAEATTITFGTHASGDIIVIFAGGGLGSITVPANWTAIDSDTDGPVYGRLYYRIAASASETSGTWTNAQCLIAHVYRGQHASPIGGFTKTEGASNTVNFTTVTMSVGDGTSWVLGVGRQTNATNIDTLAPTGMTSRGGTAAGRCGGNDTNAGVASWSTQSITTDSSGDYITWTLEILAASGTVRHRVIQQ